jgi:hypothetical protein
MNTRDKGSEPMREREHGCAARRGHGWWCLLACTLGTGLAAAGCQPGSSERIPPTYRVSGTVRIDAAPLSDGFSSMIGPEDAARGLAPAEGPIVAGAYDIQVRAGQHTVRITAPEEYGEVDATGIRSVRETVAAAFNTESTLTAEVKAGTENRFNFEVQPQQP